MTSLIIAFALTTPGLKIRVDGEGYLRFIRDGRAVYAKEAALQVSDGKLADSAGDTVLPAIQVGPNATNLEMDLEGHIFATYQGQRIKAGQLVLAMFPASEAFRQEDVVLIADDRPKLGNPGDEAFGVVRVVTGFDKPQAKLTLLPATLQKLATPTTPGTFVVPDSIANQFVTRTQAKAQNAKVNTSGTGLQITIQEHSVVDGDHILLGAVAQIDGDPALVAKASSIELGDTPPTGIKRIIDRSRVLGRLRQSGINPDGVNLSVPESAEVRRKGQMIVNSQFVVTAIQAILAKGGLSGTWESTDSFADLEVPSGKVDLKAEQITGEETGNAAVVVAIYVGDSRFNSRTVHLHLKDNVPPIQMGAAVKVILVAGHAQVEVAGVARSQGRMGQTIQVEVKIGNPPVKTYHTGTVTGAGTVEVKL
jgi:hypothetical protein